MDALKFILQLIFNNFKNIVVGTLFIFVAIFAYTIYKNWKENDRLHTELIGQTEAFQRLSENTAKLEVQYKAQEDLLAKVQVEFKEVVKSKDEHIRSLSDVTFLLRNHAQFSQQSDLTYVNIRGGRSYIFNEVRLSGADSPPVGWVMIFNDGEVRSGNYRFEVKVEELQTIDETSGRVKVYAKAFYIVKQAGLAGRKDKQNLKNWQDIPYSLPINDGTVIVDPTIAAHDTKDHFIWWAPRFGLGLNTWADATSFKIGPNVTFSPVGYGKSKNDLKFKFVDVGVGFGKTREDLDVNAKPIMYRPISIFPNTYVGPGIGYDLDQKIKLFMSLEVNF